MSSTRNPRLGLLLALIVAATATCAPGPTSDGATGPHWVGTWAASPQRVVPYTFANWTVRQVVRISLGGDTLRVRFSNEYGSAPLVIGAVRIALSAGGGAVVAGSSRAVTFGGAPSVTVPSYAPVLSDPVILHAPGRSDLAISMWLPDSTTAATGHSLAVATTYVSTSGDHTDDATLPTDTTFTHWYFLTGVSVAAPADAGAIVTVGNSITDGYGSTVDADARWPDVLAARLQADPGTSHLAVLNEGISGNRLLHDVAGPNALSRFDRDILAQPGVRYVVVLEGINDIGFQNIPAYAADSVSADEIIGAHHQLIVRAHEAGVRVYGATLTPFEGAGYATPEGEVKRQAVNQWIRTSGEYDGVVDFDKATQDPAHTGQFLAAYDSGDHLHPGDAGYKAMGEAVDLALFKASTAVGGPSRR